MAKVVITIEDIPGDKVKIVSDPSMETMFSMVASGNNLTSAHGYAAKVLNEVRKFSKSQDPTNLIQIPKIGR